MNALFGMKIVESTMALERTNVPAREHVRRRWMADNYHRRIQKKWLKRFGTVSKPCMFQFDPRAAGLPGEPYLLVHPALMPQLRAAVKLQSRASASSATEKESKCLTQNH